MMQNLQVNMSTKKLQATTFWFKSVCDAVWSLADIYHGRTGEKSVLFFVGRQFLSLKMSVCCSQSPFECAPSFSQSTYSFLYLPSSPLVRITTSAPTGLTVHLIIIIFFFFSDSPSFFLLHICQLSNCQLFAVVDFYLTLSPNSFPFLVPLLFIAVAQVTGQKLSIL